MNPRDLDLPTTNPQINEAVTICTRNLGRYAEPAELRPRIVRLLRRRRHEDDNLMCLALLGGLPPMLDNLVWEKFDAPVTTLIAASRRLYNNDYVGIAQESDAVQIYSLALAFETLSTEKGAVQDLSRYRQLAEETSGRTSDSGLENLFLKKLEQRRAANRLQVKLRPFNPETLLDHKIVRKAHDLLSEYVSDRRVSSYTFEDALRTAEMLSLLDSTQDPVTVATALIDLSLSANRRPHDIARIERSLGRESAEILKNNSLRFIKSPEAFEETDEKFKPVVIMTFVTNAATLMDSIEAVFAANPSSTKDGPITQKRLKHLRTAESFALEFILPSAHLITQNEVRFMFNDTLDRLTKFNAAHAPTPPHLRLLPPARPKFG